MIFEQKSVLPVPIGELWEFMIDAPAVSTCMPGIEEFSETGEDRYAGRVRIKVGPISLRMEGSVAVTERDRSSWTARMTAEGRDKRIIGGVKADLVMTLVPNGTAETELTVLTNASVMGKLGEFGQPIMKKSADRILQQFVQNIVARIGSAGSVASSPSEV
jgi:uncharacterized protein